MTQVPENELKNIRLELQQINGRLDSHDQQFEKIDQRFEKIDSEFRVVHSSINRLAVDFYTNRLDNDQKHADLKAMFDTFMHRTNSLERLPGIEIELKDHEQRISKLEANQNNSLK